jgi:Flp pilus assembly protein TadG
MKRNSSSLIVRFFKDQSAQMLPIMAFMVVAFMSIVALSLSIGSTYVQQNELQNSANAAALAGAQQLPSATAATAAGTYSSQSGDNNSNNYMPGVTSTAQLGCLSSLTSLGVLCVAPAYANAVQVKQTMTVPMLFGGLFGKPTTTLKATATASARGSGATVAPYNVAIIVDATGSMSSTDSDSNCNNTRMYCALQGVRVLLQALSPCNIALSSCGAITVGGGGNAGGGADGSANVAASVDRVALFQFPNASTSDIADLYDCNGDKPTSELYTFPPLSQTSYTPLHSSTYEIVGFSSDYKLSDTASTLNPAPKANSGNNLVKASGGLSGCTQMTNTAGEGTYLAGAIYAAQSALVAEQAAFPGSQNVLILISDGAANTDSSNMYTGGLALTSTGVYPSAKDQCAQAVTAGQNVATANMFGNGAVPTRVYSVAYGASSTHSDCTYDTGTITPCTTMENIASSPANFFSDKTASQNNDSCESAARSTTGIPQIFTVIAGDLAVAHLIANPSTSVWANSPPATS